MNTVDASKAVCRGMMRKCRQLKENLPIEHMKSDAPECGRLDPGRLAGIGLSWPILEVTKPWTGTWKGKKVRKYGEGVGISRTWWPADMMGMGQARIKTEEALAVTSKFWAAITETVCHGRNKELGRGTGFVGEMMSSVRDYWIWGHGKTFKWKWSVSIQRYGNKPWARGRMWAVNLWVISPMCSQPWEQRQSPHTAVPEKRVEDQGWSLG